MAATASEMMTATAKNGRKICHGGIPAEFMTMSSELLPSLVSTWATAMRSAIGEMIITSIGMISAVMPRNTRMFWP